MLPPPVSASLSDAAVLVVGDARSHVSSIGSILRAHGFNRVTELQSPYAALEQLDALEPALVISRLVMDDMDGFELCRRVRAHPVYGAVPVLIVTEMEDANLHHSAFDAGASDLIQKPLGAPELVTRSRVHLEKSALMRDLQDYQTKMEEDLGNARAMQNLLMPNTAAIADAQFDYGLSISSLFAPSLTIGGDFWGIHPISKHKIALYIGDFTGHGVTAAINVFRFCTLLERLQRDILSKPVQCMETLNKQLFAILPIHLFAALFYGVLDTRKNRLTYCIAGFPPPLKLLTQGGHETLTGSGLPLAAISNPVFQEYRTDFLPGDALLLYTDALVETPNEHKELFDINQLGDILHTIPPPQRNAQVILQETIHRFRQFTTQPVDDDFTLNVYMRKRPEHSYNF